MSKFKIGDKVRFIGDIKKHEQYDNEDNYIGDFIEKYPVMTIEVYKCEVYNVKENPFWSFDENELELVKTKYKIGDKVKVREDLICGEDYGIENFVDKMEKYKGKITEIENIFKNGEYILKACDYWGFTDEMLEPVEGPMLEEPVKEFSIEDLVNAPLGTKITIDNKRDFFKANKIDFEDSDYSLTVGEEILANLTLDKEYSWIGHKITKVEIPEYKTVYVDNTKKKMTLKEIEEKIGYEIELMEE